MVVGASLPSTAAVPDSKPAPTKPSTRPISTTQPALRPVDHLDVLEAVFRHQFVAEPFNHQNSGPYFLALDGNSDPSDALLLRFARDKRPVFAVSRAVGASDLLPGRKEKI